MGVLKAKLRNRGQVTRDSAMIPARGLSGQTQRTWDWDRYEQQGACEFLDLELHPTRKNKDMQQKEGETP